MHLTINNPLFTGADGGKPGSQITFSSNPKSAEYSPGNVNRCRRVLEEKGLPARPRTFPSTRETCGTETTSSPS